MERAPTNNVASPRQPGHAPTATHQRLGEHELAFWRAVQLEGLPIRAMADRYLPGTRDSRRALINISRRLARAATLLGAKRLPGLFERAPPAAEFTTLPAPTNFATAAPTLDLFAQQFPEGFYTERELQQLFQETYPQALPAARAHKLTERERYIRHAARALDIVRAVAVDTPAGSHQVTAWFPPPLAQRLDGAKLHTLADLAQAIDARGARWHHGVRAIGATKARRISDWLLDNVPEFAARVGDRSWQPIRRISRQLIETRNAARAEGQIAPYEAFAPPPALSGIRSALRVREAASLRAVDDRHAIEIWFRSKVPTELWSKPLQLEKHPLFRSYRREIERLWAWAVIEQGTALGDLNDDHAAAYVAFLDDPLPVARWIGPSRPRWHPDWRPFQRPLTPASRNYAITVVRSLFEFLTQQRYIARNPWQTLPRPKYRERRDPTSRALTPAQWEALRAQLAALPASLATLRLRAAITLLAGCGLRISEAAAVRCGHFNTILLDDGEAWQLEVKGKGDKLRQVPLTDPVLAEVASLLEARGLNADPRQADPTTPLLPAHAVHPRPADRGWSAAAMFDAIKAVCTKAAIAIDNPREAYRLSSASPHWMRHTYATELVVRAKVPLSVAQNILGHASVTTTAAYSRGTAEDVHRAARAAARALALTPQPANGR